MVPPTLGTAVKRVCVLGGGSLGSLVAGYLGLATAPTYDVAVLSASAGPHVQCITSKGGIVVTDRQGVDHFSPIHGFSKASEVVQHMGRPDVVVVAVKSSYTKKAAMTAHELLGGQGGVAITIQNGIGNYELLARELGLDRTIQAVTSHGAVAAVGSVRHLGLGQTVVGGNVAPPLLQMAAGLMDAALPAPGTPTTIASDVRQVVWDKLIVNCGINALSALLRTPNAGIMSSPSCHELIEGVVHEVLAVARAEGVPLTSLDTGHHVERVLNVATLTAKNHSSMLQDVLKGQATEISAMNGGVAALGRKHGIPTPINSCLATLVEAIGETVPYRVGSP